MTYDPNNRPNPQDPYENPYRVNEANRQTGNGVALVFGALLLAAIGGFIYFTANGDRATTANNEIRPPITQSADPAPRRAPAETTGSGASSAEPAPMNTPAPMKEIPATPPANSQQ